MTRLMAAMDTDTKADDGGFQNITDVRRRQFQRQLSTLAIFHPSKPTVCS